ncbi:SRPBCC family protein [soil metagenome]
MSELTHYVFEGVWLVDAEPRHAFAALRQLEDYPAWWPEVKEVWRLSEDTVGMRCRSLLPYNLRFTMRQCREDAADGILEVALSGDLEGFSRWTISPWRGGSRLLFEEEVLTNKKVLNRLAPVAKAAFKLNHTLMMSHGHAGLRAYLAGYRRAYHLEA